MRQENIQELVANATIEELTAMKIIFEAELHKKSNRFSESISEYERLRAEEEKARENLYDFKKNNNLFKKLEKLGFSVVIYDNQEVGLINFSIEKDEGLFYGCKYSVAEGFCFKGNIKPTDEEIEKLKAIIQNKDEE